MDIKIVREYKVPFKQIVAGEVFTSSDNYYMRTESENVNAVNLGTGGVTRFADDEIVAPVDCYLALE